MPADFPSPDTVHPIPLPDGTVHQGTVFLKAAIRHSRIEVGDYSYASAFDATPETDWAAKLAPYLYDFSAERLVIGRFCQIADGALFITASANHRYDGFSSFPFAVFTGVDPEGPRPPSLPGPGADTVIGHDVWIGQGARILPGVVIGSGCIIGAGAVVAGHVPPYAIVTGNPGKVLRRRFDEATITRLLEIAWWDWPIEAIQGAEAAICGGDLARLEAVAREVSSRG
ncbi:CatB-related O-acetyltransferase [Chachezhania sediminis]|uniref:CatB-related O-acetyltransferase n=1 Tax=Chachezhania sediminis TaxID=2599291 RepID=UPI00131B4F35|nr:CatB-related O-acetyltransferase [Chachezhania sediminis]